MTKVWSYRIGTLLLAALVSCTAGRVGAADDAQSRAKNAAMLIQTLSEEKTEVQQLAAQQAILLKSGGRQNRRIASLLGRMIREHKAAAPAVVNQIRRNGGDPAAAKILKAPVLGNLNQMLHADMVDHMKAESTSQMRHGQTSSGAVKMLMKKRAGIARKHMRWMKPYHSGHNCAECAKMMHGKHMKGGHKMAAMCPHCNVKMKDGKCSKCGMTMEQMKGKHMEGGQKAAAMCSHCNVEMKDGKCPMCGMTQEQMAGHDHG